MPTTDRVILLRTKHADFHGSIRGLNSKALLEKKPALVGEMRTLSEKINTEKRDFTAEEGEKWALVNEHYDVLAAEIDEAADPTSPRNHKARIDALNADIHNPSRDVRIGRDDYRPAAVGGDGTPPITEETRGLALQAWLRYGSEEGLTRAQTEACRAINFNPGAKRLTIPLLSTHDYAGMRRQFRSVHRDHAARHMQEYKAAMTIGSGPSGGYLIAPETMVRSLEINMLAYGEIFSVVDVMTTPHGERMSWPTADDTSNMGVQLGENTSIGSSVEPTFGKVYWDAYKFSSKPILVPYELLEDSVFPLPNLLGEMLGERLGRITALKCTTGSGASTPRGIVTSAALGVTAASGTAIAADEIIRLEHSVDPAYRSGAGYMMHDGILLALRLLKDGEGRPLWQSGFNSGVPDTLNARPVTINQNMQATVATGTKTILFGQMSKYKVRRVNSIRMYRLQERYRDTDQDGFVAFLRLDGNLLDAGTHPIKYLLQA